MIKKITLVAIAVVAISTATFAQLQFGVKGGLNLANLSGDVSDTKMKIGFMVGGFASYEVNEQLSVQPELMFSQAGCKYDIGSDTYKINLNYIVLPVMVKYSFGDINLQAGPQIGFLLSAEDDGEDIKDGMKSVDFGLNIGAGYQMDKIGIEARYNLGLSNINDGTGEVKTNGIQILVSYKF